MLAYYQGAISRSWWAAWDWATKQGILLTWSLAAAVLFCAIVFTAFRALRRYHSWSQAMSEVRTAIMDFVLSAIAGTAVLFAALFGVFFVSDAPEQIQVRIHNEQINTIGTLIANGNAIARTFEDAYNKDLIASQYREWEQQVLAALSVKFDQGYVSQFSAVRGNGLMLLNHNFEGDGWYSLLQGKLAFLNAMINEIRKQ
jgi:hypothetical protein